MWSLAAPTYDDVRCIVHTSQSDVGSNHRTMVVSVAVGGAVVAAATVQIDFEGEGAEGGVGWDAEGVDG